MTAKGGKEKETLNEETVKETTWRDSRGETNQKRKDFLWLPVLQWDSIHLFQLISFMDQAFKVLEICAYVHLYHMLFSVTCNFTKDYHNVSTTK